MPIPLIFWAAGAVVATAAVWAVASDDEPKSSGSGYSSSDASEQRARELRNSQIAQLAEKLHQLSWRYGFDLDHAQCQAIARRQVDNTLTESDNRFLQSCMANSSQAKALDEQLHDSEEALESVKALIKRLQ